MAHFRVSAQQQHQELRVCTHNTCRRAGSLQTLQLLQHLAPSHVSVKSCACLGRCGSGPNLILLPAQILVSHCSTAAHAARFLELQCGAADADNNLAALALTHSADKAAESGELDKAYELYTQAIQLKPTGGLHSIYAKRSTASLAMNKAEASLMDARVAAELHPQWPLPYLKQADAYVKLGKYELAEHQYSVALSLDPSLRRSKSFQRKLLDLDKLVSSQTVTIST